MLTAAAALTPGVTTPGEAAAQSKLGSRWQGKAFIVLRADTALGGLIWEIDTTAARPYFTRLIDSVLAANSTGWNPDTLDAAFTDTTGRRLNEKVLAGGNPGSVLMTNAGRPTWVADPGMPDRVGQHFYWTSIEPQNAADTASDKHVAYIGQISREWPVPHGTTYSAVVANVFIRGGTFETESETMVTVGSGSTAIVAGDRLLLRFKPGGGTGVDKRVRVFRIPTATAWIGGTAGVNKVYGEEIGYFEITAAKFPSSGAVNVECTLTLKVK